MHATSEYLAATQAARVDLVLLHGWGCDREVWRPLLVQLRSWANVTLVDVPGCSPGISADNPLTREQVLEDVLVRCPDRAVYVGWSLGGQLAMQLAYEVPERVLGVVALCANPRFVAEQHWPGVAAPILARFTDIARQQMPAAMRRFHAMQRLGSAKPDVARYPLQRCSPASAPQLMAEGLVWLDAMDLRTLLPQLSLPQLYLLASEDNLVPSALAEPLSDLVASGNASATVEVLDGVSHIAPMEAPERISRRLKQFLLDETLLKPAAQTEHDFEKRDVAESFSRAASSYDAVASLQRDVGSSLLKKLDALNVDASTVLDLGCGTGAFSSALRGRFPAALHVGLDLAPGMVAYARDSAVDAMSNEARHGDQRWLVGDAELIPLASGSVDLVFSSLAIQWCRRPDLLFSELARVLRPGGRCVFATLGPATLHELRDSWASVDEHQHVNRFLPMEKLQDAGKTLPGVKLSLDCDHIVMRYERVKDLLLELKALGAHNVNRRRANGLTSPAALRKMQRAYERQRKHGLLPATYEVVFGVMEAA